MPTPTSAPRAVKLWLDAIYLLIALMVVVGGITRLTGSGLSMVEWEPVKGALPPLSHQAWVEMFERYQASPQFQKVNHWMSLRDFQQIFFWEYVHRLLGRLIGLVVFLPWLWFLVRRQLSRGLVWKTLLMLVLGGSQGLLGWYMVASGLVDVPRVSHFRLAAHLLLAFGVAQYVLWVRLGLGPPSMGPPPGPRVRWAGLAFLPLLVLQIAYGAFMAGTHAGLYSSSFPDINGHYLPGALRQGSDLVEDLLYGQGLIHWTHRWLGLLTALGALGVAWVAWRDRSPALRGPARALVGLVLVQYGLGVATVMLAVPTAIAVAHQLTALLLLSCVVWMLYRARGPDADRWDRLVREGVLRPGTGDSSFVLDTEPVSIPDLELSRALEEERQDRG